MATSRSRKTIKKSGIQQPAGPVKKTGETAPGRRLQLLDLQDRAGNLAVSRLIAAGEKAVTEPGDPQEQQAERLAEDLLRPPASGKAEAHQVEEETAAPGSKTASPIAPGRGQPLSAQDRAFFESRLGQDLSQVRLHTDAGAGQLAEELEARAFTTGRDIMFGPGEYKPQTDAGKALLGHELAHVVQPEGSASSGSAPIMRAPKDETGPQLKAPPSLSNAPPPVVVRTPIGVSATVYFAQDSALLDGPNYTAVEKLGEEMRFLFKPTISVEGYASGEGGEQHNLELSELRRQLVIALLSGKTTEKVEFLGEAHGEKDPAVSEEAGELDELEKQRAFNRRVEIHLIPTPAKTPEAPEKKKLDLSLRPTLPGTPGGAGPLTLKPPPPLKPRKFSIAGAAEEKFNEFSDDLLDKFGIKNDFLRGLLKKGARSLIEKGIDTALDEALDQTSLGKEGKEAFKKSVEAFTKIEFEF